MPDATDTAQIVSLAAVREAKTKQRITPRNFAEKPHDGSHDAPNDGAMTAAMQPHDDPVTGHDTPNDGAMTAAKQAANRLQSPRMIQWLQDQYSPEEAASILTGALLLVRHIAPGEECNATEVIKATVADGISYRMLTDKCKPLMVQAGIWNKNSANKFHWVNWKKPESPANGVQMETDDVQMAAGQGANAPEPAASTNLIDRLRQWQRNRYLQKAKADVWCKVKDDGTVEAIPKPGQGAMTEKQKELHRKAAWADHEAKLKFKIEAAGNKELMQTIQREELQAVQQAKAITNQAMLLAAEARAKRQLMWVRLQPLVYVGAIAAVGLFLAYNKADNLPSTPTSTHPVQGYQQ